MEARYYSKEGKLKDIRCTLCPIDCLIKPGKVGSCRVRKNIDGRLFSLAQPFPGSIDPIEKKPLYHFYPSKEIFSIGTFGCNLHCKHCQNFQTSQESPELAYINGISPQQISDTKCDMIAYTYNEPTVFYEFMLECAKLAHDKGKKNVIVSNGFINKEPLLELIQYIDAANIDLKAFNNDFYKKICGGNLKPVLDSIKLLYENNVWIELTNLIIPTLNDDFDEIKKMCEWIKDISLQIPLHFSAFHPFYELNNLNHTPLKTLLKARQIALDVGLKYVYLGNVMSSEENNTVCPKCKMILINRVGYSTKSKLKTNHCPNCNNFIPGRFK